MAFQSEFASRGVEIVRDHGASELTNNDGIKKSDFLEGIFDGIDDFECGVVVLWVALGEEDPGGTVEKNMEQLKGSREAVSATPSQCSAFTLGPRAASSKP